MWVQIAFAGRKPWFDSVYGGIGGMMVPGELAGEWMNGNVWITKWFIRPNPWWEQINIGYGPGTVITMLKVDTWCVPEPSSLLALGAFGLIPHPFQA